MIDTWAWREKQARDRPEILSNHSGTATSTEGKSGQLAALGPHIYLGDGASSPPGKLQLPPHLLDDNNDRRR